MADCAFGTMLGWLEAHRGEVLDDLAVEEATWIAAQLIIESKREVINHYEKKILGQKVDKIIALRPKAGDPPRG